MPATNDRILGLDPAAKCGFAGSHPAGIFYGVWDLTDKSDKHPGRRLERFRRLLYQTKRSQNFDVIGFEDAAFGSNNANTAAMHNELRGIIKLCAAEWDIPVYPWKPNHLKKWLTGHGNATKQDMIEAVSSRFGIVTTDDNEADAITVMERTRFEISQGVLR